MDENQPVSPLAAGPSRRRGILAALVWLVILAALTVAYAETFSVMWIYHWFPAWDSPDLGLYERLTEGDSYYTHGPLIPLVAVGILYLLVRYTKIRIRPNPVAGLTLTAACLALHVVACIADVQFIRGFIFVGVLLGLVVCLWGFSGLRRLWFPVVFLAFMMPLAPVMITQLNFRLKMLAAGWGAQLADWIAIPCARRGSMLLLADEKVLQVGNVCSGLRTLISLMAFGALYCYVCRLRGLWRLGMLAMVVPVTLVANTLRILCLIVVAHVADVETATGIFHDGSGVLIFVFAFLGMFGLEKAVLSIRRAIGRPATVTPLMHDVRRTDADRNQAGRLFGAAAGWGGWVAAGLCVVAAVGAVRAERLGTNAAGLPSKALGEALPKEMLVDGRRLVTAGNEPPGETELRVLGIGREDYLRRVYSGAGGLGAVEILVTYSRGNRRGVHPPDQCIEGSGSTIIAKGTVTVREVAGREELACRELVTINAEGQTCFVYVYKLGNRYTSNWYAQQLMIIWEGLRGRGLSGALIRVAVRSEGSLEAARKRATGFLRVALTHLDRELK